MIDILACDWGSGIGGCMIYLVVRT
jgi:hypothetical protein